MDEKLTAIKITLKRGDTDTAIDALQKILRSDNPPAADAYYLLGNAFRKKGDWQNALNNYQEAIALDASGPATAARAMLMDILNFYHKDMFNQ